MTWRIPETSADTILIRGGIPRSRLSDILAASKIAADNNLVQKYEIRHRGDGFNEYSYVRFCVLWTTEQILKARDDNKK